MTKQDIANEYAKNLLNKMRGKPASEVEAMLASALSRQFSRGVAFVHAKQGTSNKVEA